MSSIFIILINIIICLFFIIIRTTMNQQVKQRIKSSICSKDKWVLDKQVSNCFRCDKKFNPIFLRKHHCRICGHIFCAACSEYFLPGEDLDIGEKNIRMCELCHKKILRYITEHDNKGHHQKQEKDDTEAIKSKTSLNSRSQQLKDLIAQQEEQTLEFADIKEKVEEKVSILVQIMIKQNKIPFEYYEYLVKLILRVVKDVSPNAMTTGNMNICKHIKIMKTRHQNHSQSKYMVGTAVPLNVFSKKIASKYNTVKVMLVYGGMELSDIMGSGSSFESLLENRKKQLNNLIYTLVVVIGVNIIFIQKNVEKQVVDLLHQNSITVISRVSISTLTRLKNSLEITKIVDGISKLKSYPPQQITGMCKSIYLQKIGIFPQDEKNYLIVEGQRASCGLTIALSGPTQTLLKRIKKQLKPLFVIARHLYLKLSAIIMDQKLMQSRKVEWRKSGGYPNLLFKMFSDKHINTQSYLKQNYLTYKRIIFVETDYSIFPEIPKEQYQFLSQNKKRFQKKWEHFTEICCNGNGFKDQNRRFYSQDDWPLGQYLLKKLLNIQRRCERCQQPGYKHIEMYYGYNLYVKVVVEARIIQERSSQRIVEIQQNYIQNVFQELAKRKEKHKIQHYIECEDCQVQLSSRFYVNEQHLEMSLLGFLGNIFGSTNYSMLKPYLQPQKSTCQHQKMCRVFQLGDTFLKVYTGFLILAPKYQMAVERVQEFIEQKNSKYIKEICLLQHNHLQKIILYLQQQLKSFSDLTKSADFQAMIKNPKASMIKAKTSFVRNSMLTQSQCMQILIPQILEQVQRVQVAAQNMLNAKKVKTHCEAQLNYRLCANILNRISNVITSMKKSAQKRQLNQKYAYTNQENDLLQNFDMDELMDGSKQDFTMSTNRQTRLGSHYTQNTDRVTLIDEASEDENMVNWISLQEGEPINRKYRKSQTAYPVKKQLKPTQSEIDLIFKMSHWPYKYQNNIVQHLTPNPHVAQSLIAAALNSITHKQSLVSTSNLTSIQSIRIKLTEGDNNQLANQYEDLKKIYTLVEVQQKMMQINTQKKNPMVEINILYPQMFEEIRNQSDINIQLYIQTIAGVDTWVNSGGKSGSPFMRAHNDLVIIKKITERQFYCLKKILPNYLKHLEEGSLLTPIFGSYEVVRGPKTQYFIVMQNLFFGMNNWQIFDFKGSKTKRYSKPPVIPLDINYILDRNSQPLMTANNIIADLPKTLQFLANNNIIDYSLVLVVNIEDPMAESLDGFSIKIGIIDYLRSYGGLQKIQTVIKGLKGNQTTVIGAQPYKDRMLASVTKYFCSLPH